MFWRFGGIANFSTLDNILDKPDVTLEELLEEQDLIQELKAQNAKLIEYLRDEDVLDHLLKYVIAQPAASGSPKSESPSSEKGSLFSRPKGRGRTRSSESIETTEEKQEKQRLKFAFVACEILSSEVWSISESLLANPDQLRAFWDFIKQDAPLSPVQAGYFAKVNEALFEKKPVDMVALIKSIDDVVVNMMKHVDCPMIMDLLLKMISLEKEPDCQGIIGWLQEHDLIPMLLSFITPDHSAVTQTSAGDFLKAIITISANATGQDTSVIGPNELTRQLVSEPCVQSLMTEMLKGGNPLTVGVGIVIEVIRKNNSDYDSESQIGPEPKSTDPIYLGALLRIFSNHISDFMRLILSSNHTIFVKGESKTIPREELKVAWGGKIEPLGFDRFKTCELMAELLHCSNMGLLNQQGGEAEVKRRDAERERLKADGKLAAALQPEQHGDGELGTSVDSQGFHHADAFSPLGEAPEDIKKLEVQNNTGIDDEFEKVNISEADSESEGDMDEQIEGLEAGKTSQEDGSAGSDKPVEFSSDMPEPLFTSRTKSAPPSPADATEKSGCAAEEESVSKETVPSEWSERWADGSEDNGQPGIQREQDGSPVVGDLLKIMFVEHKVVPTILDFFFRFPWNNFLHNVVYDVVQQVFNGSMDRGYNRQLAIDLFKNGKITTRVIEGQQRSDKSQEECKMRLGYMGHLTLIAEEIVKFTEKQPVELLDPAFTENIMDAGWVSYVENTLAETRERDNAILGGVRPDGNVGPRQAVLNAVNASQGGIGNSASMALAGAGLGGNAASGLDSMDLQDAGAGSAYLTSHTLLSGFGSSDDEDEDDIEDGELSEAVANATNASRQFDDEEQGRMALHSIGSSNTTPSNPPDHPPPLPVPAPAPLSVAPTGATRARYKLGKVLAEKKRLADEESAATAATSTDEDEDEEDGEASGGSRRLPPTPNLKITPGREDQKQAMKPSAFWASMSAGGKQGEDDEEEGEEGDEIGRLSVRQSRIQRRPVSGASSEGDELEEDQAGRRTYPVEEQRMLSLRQKNHGGSYDDDEDDEDEEEEEDGEVEYRRFHIKRQTTREALERQPLEVDDGSSGDEADEKDATLGSLQVHKAQSSHLENTQSTDEEEPSDEEDGEEGEEDSAVRNARRRSMEQHQRKISGARAAEVASGSGPSSPTALARKAASMLHDEEEKKHEQEKLLKRWGLSDEEEESETGTTEGEEEEEEEEASANASLRHSIPIRTSSLVALHQAHRPPAQDSDSDDDDSDEGPIEIGMRSRNSSSSNLQTRASAAPAHSHHPYLKAYDEDAPEEKPEKRGRYAPGSSVYTN